MILSMTGHGRAVSPIDGKNVVVEIKSVNSRFLDVTCKMPKVYYRFEDRIKQLVSSYTQRGKIEIYVSFENFSDTFDELVACLNRAYLKSYLECLYEMRDEFSLKDDITVCNVAQNKDIFTITKPEQEGDEEIWSAFSPVLEKALCGFYEMKKTEGERLSTDVLLKLGNLEAIIEDIKTQLPFIVSSYRERLTARITEMLGSVSFDETRLLTEVAIFADKVAVDEEMVRLSSHFAQFREILNSDANQVGKKLDFLLQEINREINTTGSKTCDAKTASLVVDAKSEAEKIREQIQNLE